MKISNNLNSRTFRLFAHTMALLASLVFISPVAFADSAQSDAVIEQSIISINQADAETIAASLTGVGISKAEAIVAWRQQNGGFTSLEQLLEVKGIGEKTLERNLGKISL